MTNPNPSISRRVRAFVLGGPALALAVTVLSVAAGTGIRLLGGVWFWAAVWTVLAALACGGRCHGREHKGKVRACPQVSIVHDLQSVDIPTHIRVGMRGSAVKKRGHARWKGRDGFRGQQGREGGDQTGIRPGSSATISPDSGY